MSQLVVLAQGPTVKVAGAMAGIFLLAVTAVVIVPASAVQAQAEILKSTVSPGRTLLSEAVTATKGFVDVGVGAGLGNDDEGDAVGVEVGVENGVAELDSVGELDSLGATLGELDALGATLGELDSLGDTAGELDSLGDTAGELDSLGELDTLDDTQGELDTLGDTQGELDAQGDSLGQLDALDGLDALGELDKAMLVMPVEMINRPVATPSVTIRECEKRMGIPPLRLLSRLENVIFGMPFHSRRKSCLLGMDFPFDTKTAFSSTPDTFFTSPQVAAANRNCLLLGVLILVVRFN